MKKIITSTILSLFFISTISNASTIIDNKYNPITPKDFSPINWVSAVGINSYYKPPKDNGSLDYITRIYLPKNEIIFLFSQEEPKDLNIIESKPFSNEDVSLESKDINNFHNLSFKRITSEESKNINKDVKFIWDAAFFNMKTGLSDLSMAVKYTSNGKTVISSGSRSVPDMARSRKMLIINNKTNTAKIEDFNSESFLNNNLGDQAIEGFSADVIKGEDGTLASRLFIGVSNDGKELVIYCSKLATEKEASNALSLAGVSKENQMQADGGGSASCGYNLPGQFFVEPTRTLPLLMAAKTIFPKGKIISKDVNIRDSNSKQGKVLRKSKKDEMINIYEEKNGWYRIGDNEWIMKSFVK